MICYDEIDSSKTLKGAIQDMIESAPADCLGDIYADKGDRLSDSDADDRGAGINLDTYIRKDFLVKDATRLWMQWDGE